MIKCFIGGFKLGDKRRKLHNGILLAQWYLEARKEYKERLKESDYY